MQPQRALNIVLIGRSGSGKGTQAQLLLKKLQPSLYVVTGELFRKLAKKATPLAQNVKATLDRGGLPPAWLAIFLWQRELLTNLSSEMHLIMDGTPRRVAEAEMMDTMLPDMRRTPMLPLHIRLSKEEAKKRLLLRSRYDDTASAIENRLAYFDKQVLPVVEYYRAKGRLIEINGKQSVEAVFGDIMKALGL